MLGIGLEVLHSGVLVETWASGRSVRLLHLFTADTGSGKYGEPIFERFLQPSDVAALARSDLFSLPAIVARDEFDCVLAALEFVWRFP